MAAVAMAAVAMAAVAAAVDAAAAAAQWVPAARVRNKVGVAAVLELQLLLGHLLLLLLQLLLD